MLQILETVEEKQAIYPDRDKYRLENLSECLKLIKNGLEYSRIQALDRIEKILLRIHDTYGIAWDFGGVLMDGHNKFFIELYARSHGIELSKEQLVKLWETIFKSDPIPDVNYDALKIGQATPSQFAAHAIEHFNLVFAEVGKEPLKITNQEIQNFLTLYYSHYDPKHENREVLARLHRLGIRQYGLTNNFMAKIEYFLEQHEFDYLQWLIMLVSEKFGASKPDPKIYLSFKQHVFIDRFAKEVLQVELSDRAIDRLWKVIFQEADERDGISQYAIEQYNQILEEHGCASVDVTVFAERWLEFWSDRYEEIAEQTIFVDDKLKNLDRAFESEGILGVHYDANQGQKLIDCPVIRELLEQEQLKKVVRTLREFAIHPSPFGQRVKEVLNRLMPFRIRQEKLIWQAHSSKHQPIIEALGDEQINDILQRHYTKLYDAHLKLGQLVAQQYTLVHRLASLPEYTYDEARQIVLELFETSDLFLDQNRDLYPWQETQIPKTIAIELGDVRESESILKKKLLPEIKRKIVEYVNLLDVSHQPTVRRLLDLLQGQTNDLDKLKYVTEKLLEQISALKSMRVVPWQQLEQLFAALREQWAMSGQCSLDGKKMLDEWYRQCAQESQTAAIDSIPLKRTIAQWESEIHLLESNYFQQYRRWKLFKDRAIAALYRDNLLDEVRDRFSEEDIYQLMRGLMLRVYDLPRWKDLSKPTIVLISGASGSGKSTLATQLAQCCGIQKVFSTDETGRANTKAILDFLFTKQEAAKAFPALYQSSFEGNLESYYYQASLTAIAVEGLAKRLHAQNTSAAIEGVGLMPGLLSELLFEILNIDWIVIQVNSQQHRQHFAQRAKEAAQRDAKRYQTHFDTIRRIQKQIVMMGLEHKLTIVDNTGPIQESVALAAERVQGPLTEPFIEVRDPIREEMSELLTMQRQHLPLKVRFDVKRAALNLGILENKAIELLHRFGFEEVPNQRHQWIRQAVRVS
ncbi:MAG: hypothetical protein MUD14_15180 [Hydrococcus sp. Prado102]|jgi:2-phosphoglycerate kinase/FMN phosphatase YigB (HAD superfamily)|nr:hypothetical protein [Hydrococcus sp. Prado102]